MPLGISNPCESQPYGCFTTFCFAKVAPRGRCGGALETASSRTCCEYPRRRGSPQRSAGAGEGLPPPYFISSFRISALCLFSSCISAIMAAGSRKVFSSFLFGFFTLRSRVSGFRSLTARLQLFGLWLKVF